MAFQWTISVRKSNYYEPEGWKIPFFKGMPTMSTSISANSDRTVDIGVRSIGQAEAAVQKRANFYLDDVLICFLNWMLWKV